MPQKKVINNINLALLMYIPTCAFVPSWFYILLIGFSLYLNIDFVKNYVLNLFKLKSIDHTLSFLVIFAFIAFIFRLSDFANWQSIKDIYSFAYLFPFTYIVAKTVSKRKTVYKYVIFLISIEALFAIAEYIVGVSSFYTSLKLFREFENYDLLYYTRVFGLSGNSSGMSIKFIIGIVLLNIVNFGKWKNFGFEILFLIASIFTFGRIALIAIFIYYCLKLFDSLVVKRNFNLLKTLPFLLFLLFFSFNPTWTKNQFTRNNMKVSENGIGHDGNGNTFLEDEGIDKIDFDITKDLGIGNINMSGRNQIWNTFVKYGIKHYAVGYRGKKFMIGKVHAHNSYIEIFASFGVFMLLFLGFIFMRKINKTNYVLVLSLLILAFGQYLIFWGISFFDVIFYSLLFFKQPYLADEK